MVDSHKSHQWMLKILGESVCEIIIQPESIFWQITDQSQMENMVTTQKSGRYHLIQEIKVNMINNDTN